MRGFGDWFFGFPNDERRITNAEKEWAVGMDGWQLVRWGELQLGILKSRSTRTNTHVCFGNPRTPNVERRTTKLRLNLQFFAHDPDKTEAATPKRKQEARKKGQTSKSAELNSVAVLFGLFIILNFLGSWSIKQLTVYLRETLGPGQLNLDITDRLIARQIMRHTIFIGKLFLPIGLSAMLFGVVINLVQVGPLFTTEPLKPNFSRINPISGWQRLFSSQSLVELTKALGKLIIIIGFTYSTLKSRIPLLLQSRLGSPLVSALDVWRILYQVAMKVCGFLLVVAIFDYAYRRWEYNRSLRMSKKEVRDEFKQTEGNPQIKSKIRQRQAQMASRRMMQEVPKADVVITNPTHLAIALRYNMGSMAAPVVVAKGEGLVAARIREIAAEHDVTVVENKPLARALYKTVELGAVIPEDLFQAVAEVLAFVYRLKRRPASGK
jgi:flagellar biosynthetic protein FlhB